MQFIEQNRLGSIRITWNRICHPGCNRSGLPPRGATYGVQSLGCSLSNRIEKNRSESHGIAFAPRGRSGLPFRGCNLWGATCAMPPPGCSLSTKIERNRSESNGIEFAPRGCNRRLPPGGAGNVGKNNKPLHLSKDQCARPFASCSRQLMVMEQTPPEKVKNKKIRHIYMYMQTHFVTTYFPLTNNTFTPLTINVLCFFCAGIWLG